MYDAIVVGARCAGSPVAMLLARSGYRVLLVDRATFPSDTPSTHYVQQRGLLLLRKWDLLDRLIETKCTPITHMTISRDDSVISGFADPVDGITEAYAPRRTVLDKLLLDAAVEAGAEVREGHPVREIIVEDGRAVGIRGQYAGGELTEDRASIIIGADGRGSVVATAMEAPFYNVVPAASFIYYSYYSGLNWSFNSRFRGDQQAAGWPTHDGLTLVAIMRRRERFEEFRADPEGNFTEVLRAVVPDLADDLAANGTREERLYSVRYPDNYYRRCHGPGWALVGDAGYHKDPVTGQGISDAFEHAALVAEAVHEGLSGQRPMEEALAAFERHRDEESAAVYKLTCALSELAFPPDVAAVLDALPGNPAARSEFFGLIAGAVKAADFFAPAKVAKLLGSSA
ncbi:NAD(P)/FAD-dependent oxidoreductase [Frankia sp. Cj3]|uniref:NAD(P)/FAD-dependent oxidoreductase n=1 Tax=Frankia sp. Cj3 TaxID=2880976 RepID=UPI001EF4C1D1|nr:NAD(P)/FAD-dependent oxidoreductase [Frankia sp. Cj3]